MKKWIAGMIAFMMCAVLMTVPTFAVTPMENDNHEYDTSDYCLRAFDVKIGLQEIQNINNIETVKEVILTTADPVVLIRDISLEYSQWIRLDLTKLKADFSNFKPIPNEEGYVITVTAPTITEGMSSAIKFKVFVVDDLPVKKTAVIQFYETNLSDLVVDITEEKTLSFSDLPLPTLVDFVFQGWYLDQECTVPFLLPDNDSYHEQIILGDLILYPKWKEITVPPTKPVIPQPPDEPPQMELPGKQPDAPATSPSVTPTVPPVESTPIRKPIAPVIEETEEVTSEPIEEPVIDSLPETAPDTSKEDDDEREITTGTNFNDDSNSTGSPFGETMIQMVMLTLSGSGVCFLGISIFSDLRVLKWYHRKKSERRIMA